MNPIRCSTTSSAIPERAELSRHAVEFRRIQSGGKFVDQQQPRAGRQRTREIKHLLMGAVELAGRSIGEGNEIERGKQRVGIANAIATAPVCHRDLDIFTHG